MDGNQVNYDMIKKYLKKHLIIYNVEPKMPNIYKIWDKLMDKEVDKWTLQNFLTKIFSVDKLLVNKVMNDIAREVARDELLRLIELENEGVNSKVSQ